jgi:hypothetical protein
MTNHDKMMASSDLDEMMALLPDAVETQDELCDAIEKAEREFGKLLPAWFVPRMRMDCWQFGLLMTTGHTIGISSIVDVHQAADGSLWLDVSMLTSDYEGIADVPLFLAPTSRTFASINAAHVVAAFELSDT